MPGTSNSCEDVKNTPTSLTDTQKRAVEETWAMVYADAANHGMELFLRLFKEVPHAKGYFDKFRDKPEEDLIQSETLKNHVSKMMDGMNCLIGNLGNTESLSHEIQTLARDHKFRSVTSNDFKLVFELLQNLLRERLSEKFDEDVSESWKSCCDIIMNVVDAEMRKT